MELKGIDVSQHQANINWDKVKSSGIGFAILRLGWIGNKDNHTVDTTFERNYNEAKRVGIPVGVYVYNYCKSIENAKKGANWVVSKLKGKSLDLPVYLDQEDASIKGLGKAVLTNMCIEFNTIIEKAGYWAGVYANKDWFTNYLNKDTLGAKYTLWVAQYANSCTLNVANKDIWQYSNSGAVNGIAGRVDMNIMYRDLMSDIKGVKSNTATTVSKPKKSVDSIAVEVINGLWGNGQARVDKLTQAGYNAEEVQARVNVMLGVANTSANKAVYHTVKKGDTLWELAVKYYGNCNKYPEIKKLNGLKNDTIIAGQKLRVK